MRGESSTKRLNLAQHRRKADLALARARARPGWRTLAALALITTGLAACDPPQQDIDLDSLTGRLAISWTLGSVPLNPTSCQTERITSMNVFVLSKLDQRQNFEFREVACGLDRYSMAMVPSGPVRIFVDAVRKRTDESECVRYSGQADAVSGTQYPAQPTPVALRLVGNCP
jgi:hypothetical protein